MDENVEKKQRIKKCYNIGKQIILLKTNKKTKCIKS